MAMKRGLRPALAGGAAIVALAWAAGAHAATEEEQEARIARLEAAVASLQAQAQSQAAVAAENAELKDEVATLQAQVQDLKSTTSAQIQDVRTAAASTTATIAGGKPTIASGDGAFSATLHAVMQFDVAKYYQSNNLPAVATNRDLNDGTNFRRARIGIDGKVFRDFDYNFLYDFGGSGAEDSGRIQEVWLQYSALKPWRFKVGAFAPPLGLEDAGSTNGMPFLERPAAADLARGLAGADTRTGFAAIRATDRTFFSAAVTGPLISSWNSGAQAFNTVTSDEQLGYALRVAGTPLRGYDWLVHIGANASVIAQPADVGAATAVRYPVRLQERPELRVDGTRLIDTGGIDADGARALGLEFALQKQNLFAQAEYFDFKVDRRLPAAGVTDPHFQGWYIEGSWVLTGEARKYNTATAAFDAPAVSTPFDPKTGGKGAWELALRYSTVNLNYHAFAVLAADRVRGGEQDIWTAALNWYPNSAVKFGLDFLHVDVDRLNAGGLQIGQSYNSLALRSQVAF